MEGKRVWRKKLNLYKFSELVPCPYCAELFHSNVSLSRHVLSKHNWNDDFLKGFEVIETHGSVMIVRKLEEAEQKNE